MLWRRLRLFVERSLLRRAQDDQDLEAEIRFHLAEETRLLRDRGVEDAQDAARRSFGSVALTRETSRAVWVPTALEQLLQDLRFGCRILTKSPALSATAATLVALVIGGNTIVFSIMHGILTKPAAGVHAPGLVTLSWVDDTGFIEPGSSYANYRDLFEQSSTLDSLLAFQYGRFTLSHDRGSYAVAGGRVSANYFRALGVQLVKGRGFAVGESDGALVAVISHRVWQTQFEGRDDVIGKAVVVNGHPATIVGVAESPFRGERLALTSDLWLPLVSASRAFGDEAQLLNRAGWNVVMIGRLTQGRSLREAQTELAAIWARLQAAYTELNLKQKIALVPYSAIAGGNSLVAMQGERFLAVLSVVTALTLLIVCANVANLLVARAAVRQRELALRQSLGASRVRIVRMLLAEGVAIACVACLAALLFAWWVSKAVSGFVPPSEQGEVVVMPDLTPDWAVARFALVLAGAAVLAFTVAPALRSWRLELLPLLKVGEQGVVQGRSKLSSALVIVQLGFSVLLLTSAGLAFRSLYLVDNLDFRFDTRNLLLVTVNTSGSATSAETNRIFLERVLTRVSAVPGVESVSYARRAPLHGWGDTIVRTERRDEPVMAEINHVGAEYLHVHRLAPIVGRELTHEDARRPIRSAVINERLAAALWPGETALGHVMQLGPEGNARRTVEIVGVAPNALLSGVRRNREPKFVWLSAEQEPAEPGETTFFIRYTASLDAVAAAVGRGLKDVDERMPIVYMRTLTTQLSSVTWPVRILTRLLMLFAGASLIIAAIGQYSVVSFGMTRRAREFGVRMALGASSAQIMRRVLGDGFRLTVVGLTIGFALSVAVGTLLRAVLYGVTPTDSLTYAEVLVLLSTASLLACYLPARRATRIDPITTLRHE